MDRINTLNWRCRNWDYRFCAHVARRSWRLNGHIVWLLYLVDAVCLLSSVNFLRLTRSLLNDTFLLSRYLCLGCYVCWWWPCLLLLLLLLLTDLLASIFGRLWLLKLTCLPMWSKIQLLTVFIACRLWTEDKIICWICIGKWCKLLCLHAQVLLAHHVL